MVIYTPEGEVVNSITQEKDFDLSEADYKRFIRYGIGLSMTVAIPAKGNYFLRLGVRDVVGGAVGALEVAADQVKLGVAGLGLKNE